MRMLKHASPLYVHFIHFVQRRIEILIRSRLVLHTAFAVSVMDKPVIEQVFLVYPDLFERRITCLNQ
jgi:hypothetical protein